MSEYVSIFAEFETKEAAEAFLTEHGINQSIPKGGPVYSYSMEDEGIYRDQAHELKDALDAILNDPKIQTGIGGNPIYVQGIIDRAQAALAKAKGED